MRTQPYPGVGWTVAKDTDMRFRTIAPVFVLALAATVRGQVIG